MAPDFFPTQHHLADFAATGHSVMRKKATSKTWAFEECQSSRPTSFRAAPNSFLHWRKVSFLSSASTLLLHCGASFFPSLFPSLSGSLSSPPPLRLPIAPQPSSATKLRDQAPRPCAETPGSPCGVSDVSTHNASKCNTQKHCLTHTTFECKSPRVENLVKNNAGNGPEATYTYRYTYTYTYTVIHIIL